MTEKKWDTISDSRKLTACERTSIKPKFNNWDIYWVQNSKGEGRREHEGGIILKKKELVVKCQWQIDPVQELYESMLLKCERTNKHVEKRIETLNWKV